MTSGMRKWLRAGLIAGGALIAGFVLLFLGFWQMMEAGVGPDKSAIERAWGLTRFILGTFTIGAGVFGFITGCVLSVATLEEDENK